MHDITNQLALAEEIGGNLSIASVGIHTDIEGVTRPQAIVGLIDPAVYTARGEIGDRVYITTSGSAYARLVITGEPNDDPIALLAEAINLLQDATVAL
ncbi:hypothetical protein [Gordonia sp. (in: high G+C Gram-positive bacteria)]|uniref:hypothetical protein n=1 Tax=Gordonia sp. (in: high G+C Gram-positive bacteria) TaxID=84139 RepID=UPI00333F0831